MMKSLYSGVSGLTNHQTKMDVIGNNIANVNTYGFKASKAMFKDVYYQTVRSSTAGTQSQAGNNAATVGYGVQIAAISKDMSMSSLQTTNRVLDLAISGEGFFITATFPAGTVDPSGPSESPMDAVATNFDYDKTAAVTYTRMGNMGIDSYGNLVADSNKFLLGTRNSYTGLWSDAESSATEMMLQELDDANADGKVTADDFTFENSININRLIQEAYNIYTDAEGYLITYPDRISEIIDGVETITYGEPKYCTKTGEVLEDPAYPYTPSGDESEKTPVAGTFTYADLGSFVIGDNGVITTTFNNKIKAIARIEVAVFDNQDGLAEAGNTSYKETAASGEAKIKKPGEEGSGQVKSTKLEMSNVNLANEFSDMIVTQRGFQANSRIITVSDTMLEELVNLKR